MAKSRGFTTVTANSIFRDVLLVVGLSFILNATSSVYSDDIDGPTQVLMDIADDGSCFYVLKMPPCGQCNCQEDKQAITNLKLRMDDLEEKIKELIENKECDHWKSFLDFFDNVSQEESLSRPAVTTAERNQESHRLPPDEPMSIDHPRYQEDLSGSNRETRPPQQFSGSPLAPSARPSQRLQGSPPSHTKEPESVIIPDIIFEGGGGASVVEQDGQGRDGQFGPAQKIEATPETQTEQNIRLISHDPETHVESFNEPLVISITIPESNSLSQQKDIESSLSGRNTLPHPTDQTIENPQRTSSSSLSKILGMPTNQSKAAESKPEDGQSIRVRPSPASPSYSLQTLTNPTKESTIPEDINERTVDYGDDSNSEEETYAPNGDHTHDVHTTVEPLGTTIFESLEHHVDLSNDNIYAPNGNSNNHPQSSPTADKVSRQPSLATTVVSESDRREGFAPNGNHAQNENLEDKKDNTPIDAADEEDPKTILPTKQSGDNGSLLTKTIPHGNDVQRHFENQTDSYAPNGDHEEIHQKFEEDDEVEVTSIPHEPTITPSTIRNADSHKLDGFTTTPESRARDGSTHSRQSVTIKTPETISSNDIDAGGRISIDKGRLIQGTQLPTLMDLRDQMENLHGANGDISDFFTHDAKSTQDINAHRVTVATTTAESDNAKTDLRPTLAPTLTADKDILDVEDSFNSNTKPIQGTHIPSNRHLVPDATAVTGTDTAELPKNDTSRTDSHPTVESSSHKDDLRNQMDAEENERIAHGTHSQSNVHHHDHVTDSTMTAVLPENANSRTNLYPTLESTSDKYVIESEVNTRDEDKFGNSPTSSGHKSSRTTGSYVTKVEDFANHKPTAFTRDRNGNDHRSPVLGHDRATVVAFTKTDNIVIGVEQQQHGFPETTNSNEVEPYAQLNTESGQTQQSVETAHDSMDFDGNKDAMTTIHGHLSPTPHAQQQVQAPSTDLYNKVGEEEPLITTDTQESVLARTFPDDSNNNGETFVFENTPKQFEATAVEHLFQTTTKGLPTNEDVKKITTTPQYSQDYNFRQPSPSPTANPRGGTIELHSKPTHTDLADTDEESNNQGDEVTNPTPKESDASHASSILHGHGGSIQSTVTASEDEAAHQDQHPPEGPPANVDTDNDGDDILVQEGAPTKDSPDVLSVKEHTDTVDFLPQNKLPVSTRSPSGTLSTNRSISYDNVKVESTPFPTRNASGSISSNRSTSNDNFKVESTPFGDRVEGNPDVDGTSEPNFQSEFDIPLPNVPVEKLSHSILANQSTGVVGIVYQDGVQENNPPLPDPTSVAGRYQSRNTTDPDQHEALMVDNDAIPDNPSQSGFVIDKPTVRPLHTLKAKPSMNSIGLIQEDKTTESLEMDPRIPSTPVREVDNSDATHSAITFGGVDKDKAREEGDNRDILELNSNFDVNGDKDEKEISAGKQDNNEKNGNDDLQNEDYNQFPLELVGGESDVEDWSDISQSSDYNSHSVTDYSTTTIQTSTITTTSTKASRPQVDGDPEGQSEERIRWKLYKLQLYPDGSNPDKPDRPDPLAKAVNCMDGCTCLHHKGFNKNGVYSIPNPPLSGKRGRSVSVSCEMRKDGTAWTVIQQRVDASTNFFRPWDRYAHGFGIPDRNFWIGNNFLHAFTRRFPYQLRVEFRDWRDKFGYAVYDRFEVLDKSKNYRLILGNFMDGNRGDALSYHNNTEFSTKDNDNDLLGDVNCAQLRQSGFWFKACNKANPNGRWIGTHKATGLNGGVITWGTWPRHGFTYALKSFKMMIRPVPNDENVP